MSEGSLTPKIFILGMLLFLFIVLGGPVVYAGITYTLFNWIAAEILGNPFLGLWTCVIIGSAIGTLQTIALVFVYYVKYSE